MTLRPLPLSDTELLRVLVAFDTTSRNSNLSIADFIGEYVAGARVERVPSADGTKTNLVLSKGSGVGDDRRGLVLSGHMDVVPAGEEGWNSHPFTLTETDAGLVGRGACDMKGFLALALNRFVGLDRARLQAPLVLILTYDEEVGTLGARRLVEAYDQAHGLPKHAVIGEPTSLKPVRMHKGHLKLRLTVRGKAAHSGYPHLGENAIEPAALAIVALTHLKQWLEMEAPEAGRHFPDVPYVALNVATVSGGVAVNVIPDSCTVEVGIRTLPGSASESLAARVRRCVSEVVAADRFTLEVMGESPPMVLDEGAEILRVLQEEAGGAGEGIAFATDAGWLQRLGLECAIFGPGSIEVAHRANEVLPVAEFIRAGEILDRLISRMCY